MASDRERIVVISGASSGIGRATALRLDRAGWRVFAGVRSDAAADALRTEGSDRLVPLKFDIARQETIDAAARTVREHAGDTLDGLFNNAGVSNPGPIESVPLADIRNDFEVNVFGHLAMTQAFLPMLRAARGRVVFTSSVSGRVSLPFLGTYAATKHAIEAYGDALRREVHGFGIKVSIVEPGSIDTDIWEKGLDPAVRARLSPEAEALYGRGLDFAEREGRRSARMAIPADAVAKVVEHALTSSRPKRRYLVGRDAKVFVPVGARLPGVLDFAVARGIARQG